MPNILGFPELTACDTTSSRLSILAPAASDDSKCHQCCVNQRNALRTESPQRDYNVVASLMVQDTLRDLHGITSINDITTI